MAYQVMKITGDVFGIALWDSSWNSYNNCYLIKRSGAFILIDCGKEEQSHELMAALSQIGVDREHIHVLIATHGHKDHTGASHLFTLAEKWIHVHDAVRLSPKQQEEFQKMDSCTGEIRGLSFTLLGHHTEGSIALYDPATHCLFCGDHICFFGEKLPQEGLLTFGAHLRVKTREFVTAWSQNQEDRHKYRFDVFVQGLQLLSSYKEIEFLATGHGPVLRTQIHDFLNSLVSATDNPTT
jgi:glyoxylase-like metal-dependent hydrolase (beta-lactamase superfamily II)